MKRTYARRLARGARCAISQFLIGPPAGGDRAFALCRRGITFARGAYRAVRKPTDRSLARALMARGNADVRERNVTSRGWAL